MKTIKVTWSKQEYEYGTGEERKALLMAVEYIGFKNVLRIVHEIIEKKIKYAPYIRFICSFAGVQGYPVECFISWIGKFYGIEFLEKGEEDEVD